MSIILDKNIRSKKSEKIRHFIKDVGLPLNKAPEALGVTATDFLSWWSGYKPNLLRQRQLIQLGQFFNIDENQIVGGTYDKDFVRSVLFHGDAVLPERYSQNQFSYLRSSAHIMKFLTMTRGQYFSDMIMRKMNISPLIYNNFDNKISLNYFVDLLEMLAQHGLSQEEIDNLSCVLFLSISKTTLGERFRTAKTYYDCYTILAACAHLFDSNFVYSFELDRRQCYLKAFLPYDNHSHIDWSVAKMERLLRYRQILMGWFPYLSKLPPIIPETTIKYRPDGIEAVYYMPFSDSGLSPLFALPEAQLSE